MYVLMQAGRAVSEIVMWKRPDGNIEIKNLATSAPERGKGYAGELIEYVKKIYAHRYPKMYVGTSEEMIPYYERFGFRWEYTEKDFFVDNYDNEIIECGHRLRDMEYLSMELDNID